MTRVYMVNGQYVSPEEFAEIIARLLSEGWILTPPPQAGS